MNVYKKVNVTMKVAVIYNCVVKQTDSVSLPSDWASIIERYADSYRCNPAGIEHDFYICSSGSRLNNTHEPIFRGIKYREVPYDGKGWDIGSYQHTAWFLRKYDFLLCMNSQSYISSPSWLLKFVDTFIALGPSVLGASSSFEICPHIRTACIAFPPKAILSYPIQVRTRYDACLFEHSPLNFSQWAIEKNYSVGVVMNSGYYGLLDSRRIDNCFRSGTQSELLVRDRHTLIYDSATPEEKLELQAKADGRKPDKFRMSLCSRHVFKPFYMKSIIQTFK